MKMVTKVNRRSIQGFTLVELMIAMLLGLILIAGVISVFIANKQSYRSNEALSEIQDGTRVAFELMARDIREAGLTGCGNTTRVANVVNPYGGGAPAWWQDWSNAVVGYDGGSKQIDGQGNVTYTSAQADPAVTTGTAQGDRVAGTDSLRILGGSDSNLSIAPKNPNQGASNSAQFQLNESTSDLNTGDIIVVCDPDHATILQISKYTSTNVTVVHQTGNTVSPGNCSTGLGYPTTCGNPGNPYDFGANSQAAKLRANDWYIGYNASGGKSLYRISLADPNSATPTQAEEIIRNVTDMQLQYHVGGTNSQVFVDADKVNPNDWAKVDAVKLVLTVASANQRVTTGASPQPLSRTFTATVTLRNRTS